eukprot:scaffold7403_cov211-Skeletonema_dohrnii-CCMP3373.AAC.1
MSRTSESGIDLAVGLPGEQIKISLVSGVTAWSICYKKTQHQQQQLTSGICKSKSGVKGTV